MIVYMQNAIEFRNDCDNNIIADRIKESFYDKFRRNVSDNEYRSWQNSLKAMETVVRKSHISDDCGILVEYTLKPTSSRIDFIVSGKDDEGNKNLIIIELKQWQKAEIVEETEYQVLTELNGYLQPTNHPSYQAWSYRTFFEDYNEVVDLNYVRIHSLAYLHNYKETENEPLINIKYEQILEEAPIFFKEDVNKLEDFLYKYVGKGHGVEILYEINNSRIRPSKSLIDRVNSLYQGNQEFILIGKQRTAFDMAYKYAKNADKKTTVIIKGGPGTGKSVISMNLLRDLINLQRNAVFVAPNAAFRSVMVEMLSKSQRKSRLYHLFTGSGKFYAESPNKFDVIIVDEAHRLKNGSAWQYFGENQIQDIINASKVSIFFIDDNQIIRPEDIGSVLEIKRVAKSMNSEVKEFELTAQFRCSGAEGYVNWIDNVLEIGENGNFDGFDRKEFDFRIIDTPNEVFSLVKQKNEQGLKARLLAGYAWPWTSEKKGNPNAEIDDVIIKEHNFSMPWNSRKLRTLWAILDEGLNQVGCIHTAQGLEFDYVGVLIGNDLIYDEKERKFVVKLQNYYDTKGKEGLNNNNEELTKLVKNIYKTLLSRGMRGCYVYIQDEGLKRRFTEMMRIGDETYERN